MKRAIRIGAMLAAVAFAACFGAGPTPTSPTDVIVVFSTADDGCQGHYIGDVAFGSDAGYAFVIPYTPASNCFGGNGIASGQPLDVHRFGKSGGGVTTIGSAGLTNGFEPKLAASGSDVEWVYYDGSGSSGMFVGPSNTPVPQSSAPGPILSPMGLVIDGPTTYVAGWQGATGTNPFNPGYPCCTMNTGSNGSQGQISAIGSNFATVSTTLQCGQLTHCLVASSSSLYYFGNDNGGPGTISAISKSGGSAMRIGSIPPDNLVTPVGLAANDTWLAWSISMNYGDGSAQASRKRCEIDSYNLATKQVVIAFTSDNFSCLDLALDGDSAYFTIVSVQPNDNNNNGASNQLENTRGDGIARLNLVTHDLESLALGFEAQASGPRRVFVDGPDLFAVDPHAIGKLAKTALDGRHDFAP